ncbi:hypothetical protein [Massilia sp. BJB1822]|uniref:hypothetical protein n=1 Tax=Massilia sp. BJB1822 TaxID=2744470 RepID=UPI0015948211|nr:hypothetical protein [Massilia sp. BJB1822]NVD99551.1 hypothetical protein [Massilia sp. BJB1822]
MKILSLSAILCSLLLSAPLAAHAAGKRSATMQVSFTIVAACDISRAAETNAGPVVDCPAATPYQVQRASNSARPASNAGSGASPASTATDPSTSRLQAPATDSAAPLWTVYF